MVVLYFAPCSLCFHENTINIVKYNEISTSKKNSTTNLAVWIGEVHLFIVKAHLFIRKVNSFISKFRLSVGKVNLFIGKVHLFIDKVHIFIGKVHLFIGNVHLLIGKVHDCFLWEEEQHGASFGICHLVFLVRKLGQTRKFCGFIAKKFTA